MTRFPRSGKRALFSACLCCLLLVAALPSPASGETLHINNPRTGFSLDLPLKGVDRLGIRFFHSYDRQWVEEWFRVQSGRFIPVEVSYCDDSYDYRDQRYASKAMVDSDKVRLVDIVPGAKDLLKTINFRIAHIKPQRLILMRAGQTQKILFYQWGKPGDPLVFSLK
jgi:hypothetical protein